jgi:methylated-DNA-[protein]-cysteine S-methyltransferase
MGDTVCKAIFSSPLGDLLLTERDGGLAGVDLVDASAPGHGLGGFPAASDAAGPNGRGETLLQAQRQLEAYFAGRLRTFDLPLRPRGTPFQLRVWAALRQIPYGETISYSGLARRIGRPSAARAVGRALGQNPLAVVVPCHRVVGASGSLTGFAWGIERKRRLLELEATPTLAGQA